MAGKLADTAVPAPGFRFDLQLPGQAADPLPHRDQAETARGRSLAGQVPVALGHGEPGSVVAHVQAHHVLHVRQRDPGPGGIGVLDHVGQAPARRARVQSGGQLVEEPTSGFRSGPAQ
jgi:hypothetical protein